LMWFLGVGLGEQAELDAQILDGLFVDSMISLRDLQGSDAFPFRLDGDGSAMLVRSRDHQHLVPFEAVVAGEDVRREQGAGDVP